MAINEITSYPAITTAALTDEYLTQQKGLTRKGEDFYDVVESLATITSADLNLSDKLVVDDSGTVGSILLSDILTYAKTLLNIYVFGGFYGSYVATTGRYNMSDTWTVMSAMSDSLANAGAITILWKGYVFGGYDGSNKNSTFEYDPDSWTTKTNMLLQYGEMGATTIANKGYIFGGALFGVPNTLRNNIAEYDPDTWTDQGDLSLARYGIEAITIRDQGYLFGGQTLTSYLTIVQNYTVSTGITTKTSMNNARSLFSAVAIDQRGYVFGGSFNGNGIALVEEYDLDTWTTLFNMPVATYGNAASVLFRKAYTFGGYVSSTAIYVNTITKFDRAGGGTWIVQADDIGTARRYCAATTLK